MTQDAAAQEFPFTAEELDAFEDHVMRWDTAYGGEDDYEPLDDEDEELDEDEYDDEWDEDDGWDDDEDSGFYDDDDDEE